MGKWTSVLLATVLSIATLSACESTAPTGSTSAGKSRLDTVLARGKVICGVDGKLPGFSFVDSGGKYSGLDVDVCKAVAAALFDDPNAVEYRQLDSTERFTALSGGEVDMLSRNTTWTLSRDAAGGNGLEFAPTTFYDGQGMMVKQDSGIKQLKDFAGKSICVESGTTTELNLTDRMRELNVQFTPVVFQDGDATYAAYQQGRCQGVTSDKSQLLARRSTLPKPDEHILLDATMSKEPLGPVTINNDSRWFDAVRWVTYALFEGEELKITQANVEQQKQSTNPEIKRFLGVEGELGQQLGLPKDFAARTIKHVGNYQEVYDRNLGAQSQFKLQRGLNALWKDGGLIYAPPFR
jgi:general L-amino acid transport system substrate-binding protein